MTSTAMNGEINSRGGELSSPAMYGEINPDEAGENYLRKRSKGKNHLAVQVLAEKDGALMWRTFIISDMKIFPENDAELPPSLTNNIRDKMDDMDDKKMKIARVRIARYGHFIDDKELRFAELRAERIYQEILSYKDEMAAVKAANLKKELELRERRDREKADKIQRELEEKNRRRQEAEQESKRARQAPLDTAKIKEAQERREKSIIAYKLKAASFETGRSQLSQEALRNIALIAAEIKERNYKMITVEGHSDSTGSESQNQILAAQRATAVYMELLKLGIPSNKMKFISCGSSIPIAENVTPQGRALNRRVEIFVE
jgi:outer membrane protein OmpA-like peptidoglycan-associated protein